MIISSDNYDKYDGGENQLHDGDSNFSQFLTFDLNSEQRGCNVPLFPVGSSNPEKNRKANLQGHV